MGCTYVKDFDFGPAKTQVRGYARGGPVKKVDIAASKVPRASASIQERALDRTRVMQATRAAERATPASKVKSTTPDASVIPLKDGGRVCSACKGAAGITEEATGEVYPSKKAMLKHEATESPAERKAEAEAGMRIGKRNGIPATSMSPLIVIALGHGKAPKK